MAPEAGFDLKRILRRATSEGLLDKISRKLAFDERKLALNKVKLQ